MAGELVTPTYLKATRISLFMLPFPCFFDMMYCYDVIMLCVMILLSVFAFSGYCIRTHVEELSGSHYFCGQSNSSGVKLQTQDEYVILDNGILQVTIANPNGSVTGVQYNGVDNLLEIQNDEFDRGYWDVVWNRPGSNKKKTKGPLDRLEGTKMEVIVQTDKHIEISFTRTWNVSLENKTVPLNIDKRYVMLENSSGFYTYAIYEKLSEWPAFSIGNTRTAFKLRKDKFHYMAIADNRQRYMPLPDDRSPERSQVLAYPEAVRLVDPVEPEFKGEVDDKYQYSCDSKDIQVHGWISTDPAIGFWQITPSNEFRNGGPVKQFLTSHVGPTSLNVFLSSHYSGEELIMDFQANEAWKKVYGPVFLYLNSVSDGKDPLSLWEDAKEQSMVQSQNWPYTFPASKDYIPPNERGCVFGTLQVLDRYISRDPLLANGAYVGLAPPGDVGSWQRESKKYQFWTRVDERGHFFISGIRPDNYSLYAFVPGYIGDFKYNETVTVAPGSDIELGELVYEPPRYGPTLWEIGFPDRSAKEFYVPDPDPQYINKLYVNHTNRYRQYGLWEKYAELYPQEDLVYLVGTSNFTKDWFFIQATRKTGNTTYEGTTWQIKFNLESIDVTGTYKLRLALASAHVSELQVRINDPNADLPLFTTGVIGDDNSIARHGIHGLYWLYTVDVPGMRLAKGNNTIFLTQTQAVSPFQGILYDYIRLEGTPYGLYRGP